MEVQTEVLQAFSDFIGVSIGQLPEKGGAAMELSPSSALRRFFNGESYESMSVLVLAKYKSQKTALDKLNQICNKCRTLDLPSGENWRIKTIEISTSPQLCGAGKKFRRYNVDLFLHFDRQYIQYGGILIWQNQQAEQ